MSAVFGRMRLQMRRELFSGKDRNRRKRCYMPDENMPKQDGILSGEPPFKQVPSYSQDAIHAGAPLAAGQSDSIVGGVPLLSQPCKWIKA